MRIAFAALMGTLAAGATVSAAQQPASPADTAPPIALGAVAPDFALPGATRWGALRNPVRLSDYHGKTIVLAFFSRARTRG